MNPDERRPDERTLNSPVPSVPGSGGPGPAPAISDARRSVPNARVVRVAGPEDLLAYVPYRLGFEPVESAVLVSLTGPRQRVGLVARVDLSDLRLRRPGDPDGPDGAATARWLADHVVADGADRAVVVLYTGTDPTAPAGAARRAVDLIRARLDHRLPGTEVWHVSPTGFRALDCTDPLCCPPGGRPLAVLKGSRVAAHMVLEGRTVAGTREERYTLRAAPEAARTQARRAAARWTDTHRRLLHRTTYPNGGPIDGPLLGQTGAASVDTAGRPGRSERPGRATSAAARVEQAGRELADWGAESLGLWRSAVRLVADAQPGQPVTLSPVDLGKIGAALADTPVRDAVLLTLVPGTAETALRTARRETDGDTDRSTGAVMAQIVDPDRGIPPDEDLTRPARAVLEAVVTHVPRNRRAPAYLLLAILAWWHGDGGLAAERVSDALGVDPDHRLALVLRSAIAGGVPPGWVRREQAFFHREFRGETDGETERETEGATEGETEGEAESDELAAV
ncbi:DUF4192 domain-containing protein [Promicromonospora sukumoe]|uniref:DUF4192 family protein n=1 Tax=Promicromonospora sukumoe TaxID=88382 RepID=A0A7W3JA33_9MICO|nr:DUF4192 domain-containing protein [Promicromonospora sukumoe]MBA8809063.1 hypothetical protein [Promicromonospora sukumoe]